MRRLALIAVALLAVILAATAAADPKQDTQQGLKGPKQIKGKVVRVDYPTALLILNVRGKRYVVECDGPRNRLADVKPGDEVQVDVGQWLLPLRVISKDVRVVGLEGVEYDRAHRVRIEGVVYSAHPGKRNFRLRNDHRLFLVPNIATIRNGSLRPGFYGIRSGCYVQLDGWAVSPTEIAVRHLDIRSGAGH